MALYLLIIIIVLVVVEFLLRIYAASQKIISYDLHYYPYYRRPKNKRGKDSYNVERIGKKQTPFMTTYSQGIRGDIANEKRKIILAAGCSFTEGAGLTDAETFPGHLQKLVDAKQQVVINAGMGGYGFFQIEKMVEDLLKYNPAIVVVQLLDFKRVPLSQHQLQRGKKSLLFSQKVKKITLLGWQLLKVLNYRAFASVRSPYMNRKAPKEHLWEANQKYLDSLVEKCRKKGANLVLFVWPSEDPNRLDNAYFQEKVKEYCQTKKIPTFNASPMLKHYREEELQLKPDAHPSALANKLVAKAVYQCLVRNKLMD